MKEKPKNTEYKIEKVDWKHPETKSTKMLIEAEKFWYLSFRAQGSKRNIWSSVGFVTKEDVKERVSEKQYSKWRQSKEDLFTCIVERTREEAKENMVNSNKSKEMKLSDWMVHDGYCAMRIIEGTDPDVVANRVAFIEKTPRVRIAPFTTFDEEQGKWPQGPKGSGGGLDNEENEREGNYGFDPESRKWCDKELIKLGYTFK